MPICRRTLSRPTRPSIKSNPNDLYIWNNVSSGDNVYKNPMSNPRGIDYWLMQGRDYFLTAKPGYKPYLYPHSLRSIP